jgi:dissimilatory sulfite reductase (desulfoviridin) alpha/beta subunit
VPGSYVFQPGMGWHGDACIGPEDCTFAAVTTFNLSEAPTPGDANSEYAAKLRVVRQRLGCPAD